MIAKCPNCGKEISIFNMQKKNSWFEQGPYCPHCNEALRLTTAANKHILIGSILSIGVCVIVQFLVNKFNPQINKNNYLVSLLFVLPPMICFIGYSLLNWNSSCLELDKGIKKQEQTIISPTTIIIAIFLIVLICLGLNFYVHKLKIF